MKWGDRETEGGGGEVGNWRSDNVPGDKQNKSVIEHKAATGNNKKKTILLPL
jgi:hypothetical protein